MKKLYRIALTFLIAVIAMSSLSAQNPKREFRGAWLHVIGQSQWKKMNTHEQKAYIIDQFNKLQDAGCNAVIFQVRPTADAMYISELEPWTTWLTGKRGKAPSPMWDPMEFAIEEAHKRSMEFHAWLNPYRVTSGPETLPADHMVNKYPERFVKFGDKIFFDPAYQENRDFICEVVTDILERYDVDAIHIDDYFYPYPYNGKKFDADDASYKKFGNGMERKAWRRHNVDMLIEQLSATIKDVKPWVRFGVSPFGIWRNKKNDPRGSDSSGLQNYDDLYADVLLWAEKGWIDYLAPQLYWNLDLKAAPSRHLAKWWNDNANGVDVYIGQDVQRTMTVADPKNNSSNELDTKIRLSRELPNVQGNVWWHGYWVTENLKGVKDLLSNKYQNTLAIPPAYGDKSKKPGPASNLKLVKDGSKLVLKWDAEKNNGNKPKDTDVVKYVVYQFFPDEKINLEDSETIVAITPERATAVADLSAGESVEGCVFVVTTLDRMNRESEPVKVKVGK